MAAVIPLPARRAESKGLLLWMERVLKERQRVLTSPDEDAVHDLRVALRRCRSLASVFEEVDLHPSWRDLRKTSRKLFRGLGVIRDSQVLESWVLQLGSADDPLRGQLIYSLKSNREKLERDAKRSATRLDEKHWAKLARELRPRLRFLPADGPAAQCLALERLEESAELHRRALRTEKTKPWHALRIGIKHFRYAVENLLPRLHVSWAADLKRLQDLLGEVHDLDVLLETVRRIGSGSPVLAKWEEIIARERTARIETYRQLTLGSTSLWNHWRLGLPTNGQVAPAVTARLRATARAADPNFSKSAQAGRLAKTLCKALQHSATAPILNEPSTESVFQAAALLHGIRPQTTRKQAHKQARRFLSKLPAPPGWTADDWQLLSLAIRYHRGAEPVPNRGRFAKLDAAQQGKVLLLAGILRIARALIKVGVESSAKARVELSTNSVSLSIQGLYEGRPVSEALTAGKHLLERALSKEIVLQGVEKRSRNLPLEFPSAKEEVLTATAS